MIGKIILHNIIRDEMYRILRNGGLGIKREPIELLIKDLIYRPIDILIAPTPIYRQSTWQYFNRIVIDFMGYYLYCLLLNDQRWGWFQRLGL